MKKFILLLISILVLSSCGVTNTITFGDVSILNSAGDVIGQWKDSVLESTVIGNSLKFTDSDGQTHFVSGVPIKVDNIETISLSTDADEEEDIDYD